MIIVFILLVAFVVLSIITSKYDILSPAVVTSLIWAVCFILFFTLRHNLPPLTWQFLGALLLWITLFCLSSLSVQSLTFKVSHSNASQFVSDLFFWITIFTFPSFLLFVRDALLLGDTGNWAYDLRLAAVGQTAHSKEIYGGLHVIIWQVSYLVELFYFSKENKYRVFVLGAILLAFAFLTMAKAAFLGFFIHTVCILFFSKKIRIKHMLLGGGALLLLFILIQAYRSSAQMKDIDSEDAVVVYALSSMSAFDTLHPHSSTHWGENTFRFVYSALHSIGVSATKPVNPLLPFIEKPIVTNTYTVMYPFFKDFGYWGVGVAALVYGLLFGWVFSKARLGSPFFIVLYAVFLQILIMQYAADMFISALVGYIKLIIFFAIPFIAGKYKIFEREKFFPTSK